MLTMAPKGTKDMMPEEAYKWQYIRTVYPRRRRYYRYSAKRNVYLGTG